ncbi:MAG: membrane protein [Alphaproteobacteria bacterium]|nr:MAG: membrane protein [Alphaproteobacteria bacterium]
MEWLADPQIWLSLLTLTTLEIVLGIDNLVFIAVLVEKLPETRRATARRVGIALALISRLVLLSAIAWIIGLTAPVFDLFGHAFSWRDIILIGGGLFLLYKGTVEIHERLEGQEGESSAKVQATFAAVVTQIAILDIVFSLDSVITAVGMADHLWIMVTAVIVAVIIMLVASGPVSSFVSRHPTVKMLALSFLLLIGMTLVADGFGFHIPKGYIYAAMGFSVFVESLNLLSRRRRRQPVHLRQAYSDRTDDGG